MGRTKIGGLVDDEIGVRWIGMILDMFSIFWKSKFGENGLNWAQD